MNHRLFRIELERDLQKPAVLVFVLKPIRLGIFLRKTYATCVLMGKERTLAACFGLPLEWPSFTRDQNGGPGWRCAAGPFSFERH